MSVTFTQQYLSAVGWNKRESEEKEDKCFCVMKTPSLCLSLFLYLSAWPVPDASLSLRGEKPGRLIGY